MPCQASAAKYLAFFGLLLGAEAFGAAAIAAPVVAGPGGIDSASSAATDAFAAKGPTIAQIECLKQPAKMEHDEISALLAKPDALFATLRDNRNLFEVKTIAVAGSEIEGASKLLDLATKAQLLEEKDAVGYSIGRAARICGDVNVIYAEQLQQIMAKVGDPGILAGFLRGLDQMETAAINSRGAAYSPATISGILGRAEQTGGPDGDETVANPELISPVFESKLFVEGGAGQSTDVSVSPSTP